MDNKLSPELVKRCEKNKPIDILVGVISKDVETTILHVLNVVNEGLYSYFPEYKKAIVVSIGPSSDRTYELTELFQPYNSIAKIVTEDIGGKGKGAGIGTILKIAELMDAKSIILVDGDLLSIRPKWIESIAGPILYGRADLTVPFYIRDKYDGVITNMLAYPFTYALYGVDVRQPIAGEFGLSKNLYKILLNHPLYPFDFGIDIFILTTAAAEGMKIKESLYTLKIHESTTRYLEPEKMLIPMFRQVTGKMFELAKYYEKVWRNREREREGELYRESFVQHPIPVRVNLRNMERYIEGEFSRLRGAVQRFVPKKIFGRLDKVSKIADALDDETWARIVYSFAASYKLLKKEVDRYVLLESLKPLWIGRFVNYAREVKDMDMNGAERVIHRQAEVFEELFDYFASIY
jgi:hypothetical protein